MIGVASAKRYFGAKTSDEKESTVQISCRQQGNPWVSQLRAKGEWEEMKGQLRAGVHGN